MVKEVTDGATKSYTDKEEYNNALDYLGLNSKEVEDEAFLDFKIDKEVQKKVTKLSHLAVAFRMTIEGKEYDEEKGGYRQTGRSIAGRRIINKMNGILTAFASEANLLTGKQMEESFIVQYADACRKIETELLRDRSVSEKDTRIIFKTFKDTLFNLGEIICGSKENMRAVFGKIEESNKDPDKDFRSF